MRLLQSILAAAVLALFASPSPADLHRYLKPNGNNNLTGGTADSAWATMAYANTKLEAPNTADGNVYLHVLAGDYNTDAFPNPAAAPADGKRYFIIGPNLADPGLVLFPGGQLTSPYTSIKGVTFQGSVEFYCPSGSAPGTKGFRDSLVYVDIQGDHHWRGADYCVIENSTINGAHFSTGGESNGHVNGCEMNLSTMNLTANSGNHIFMTGQPENSSSKGINDEVRCDSLRFVRNRITITTSGCPGPEFFPRYHYLTKNSLFAHNLWRQVNNGSICGFRVFRLRDSCQANRWYQDTTIALGNFGDFYMSTAAQNAPYGTPRMASNIDNTWEQCLIVTSATLLWQNGAKKDSLLRNVIACGGQVLNFEGDINGVYIDHNTLMGNSEPRSYARGVVNFNECDFVTDTTKLYSNIVGSFQPGRSKPGLGTDNCPPPNATIDTCNTTFGGLFLGHDEEDATNGFGSFFKTNWNLYSIFPNRYSQGDRSEVWHVSGYGHSKPGATSSFEGIWPANRRGDADSLSTWGSAQFDRGGPDSTFGETFDPNVASTSLARGRGKDGSDIGAVAYAAGVIAEITSGTLQFFELSPGEALSIFIPVNSNGTEDLKITGATSSNPRVTAECGGCSPSAPMVLAPGAWLTSLGAAHTRPGSGTYLPATGTITFTTNDPVRPTITIPWQISP